LFEVDRSEHKQQVKKAMLRKQWKEKVVRQAKLYG